MHPRISELVAYLTQQREAVLGAASAVSRQHWSEPPGEGRWSVVQNLDHLRQVETGVGKVIAKRATAARAAGHPEERDSSSVMGSLDGHRLDDRSTPLEAPSLVMPEPGATAEGTLAKLEESRAALLDAIRGADGLALGEIKHTHLRLGEIDLYQWILFVGLHEKRHAHQLAELAGRFDTAPR